MNIDVVGRIRPSIRAEGSGNLIIDGQRIAAQSKGPFLNFSYLHHKDAGNYDVFKHSVENLLDLYLAGFNVCLLVMGESESGKSFTVAGETANKAGIAPMVFDYLFSRLAEEKFMADTKVRRHSPTVTLQMYEVYNELIKDLLQVPGVTGGAYKDLTESADKGVHVKDGTSVTLKDASDANSQFRAGMGRRTETTTDYGPASNNASTIINFDLVMAPRKSLTVGDNPQPNKSRFTIVELPGLEKLTDDPTDLRQREGASLSKALIALNGTFTSLAHNPFPDRVINYSDSKLTQLLREELGGNFKTRAILCLKPHTDQRNLSSILTFCTRVSQAKNFPVINDSFAQNLITQYRARILDLQHQGGVGPSPMSKITNLNDIQETIRQLQTDNLRLKDENERLRNRYDSVQNKFGNMATTKTDLSQQLLLTEEEKLKVSQSLVEMQIENNKLREESEATKFELNNKILLLEKAVIEAENERDRSVKGARHAKDRVVEMEKDRKDLADEYVVLKTNYLALVREHEKETKKNEELSIEVLNLVNAKAALMKRLLVLSGGDSSVGDPEAEISRVKALVIKNSSGRVRTDEILGTQNDRANVEESLFHNKNRYDRDLERLKQDHGDEHRKFESKITTLQKEVNDTRNLARDRQKKMAEMNASLIVLRGDKEQLELLNNRLQHKVKDLGEDYRSRLIKYVEDISEYVDKGSGIPDGRSATQMREYMDKMMKDITRSHKEREEQLSKAAQQYRDRQRHLIHKYEELLIHYRNLRLMCQERGIDDLDMGPDEQEITMTDSEMTSANLREIARLKTELNKTKQNASNLKTKFGGDPSLGSGRVGDMPAESWSMLRKQLREYTLNTQQQLEEERARLLSENTSLKEQLRESQDYIERHLIRYKQEIVKLRRKLGYDEDGGIIPGVQGGYSDRGPRRPRRK
ncbi:coiled-coil domain-containing protein 78-like isoform X1 [Pecten maximus]|uniref:coiled-coil domain-containing protein 78-like isoform X1 n=1 Tax=Pecten maximus TaxID=6579 RepID=UPI001458359B|nr:coiled-coil domain-containing protein 78-like isoform X1 [Pecten maximus]